MADNVQEVDVDSEDGVSVVEYTKLKKQLEEYKRKDFTSTVKTIVAETVSINTTTTIGKDALSQLRNLISNYALLVADSEDEVRVVVEQVSTDMKDVLQLLVQALAGPKAVTTDKIVADNKMIDSPENRAKARSQFGLVE